VIISIHIPRTAGTAFREIVAERLGPRLAHHYYHLMDHRMQTIDALPADVEMVHGHVRPTQLLGAFPHAALVTWLRDPVQRLFSEYRFLHDHPDDANVLSRLVSQGASFVDFAEHPGALNRMTWFLDGLPLSRFAFLGISELFDQELDRLERSLGLALRHYHRANASSRKDAELTPTIRAHIEALNVPDYRLYRTCFERALVS
jgi:hypothetical protein